MAAACDWRRTACFGSDRRLAEVSPALLRHCVLALLPASLVLHSMPWPRFVSSVVPHPVGPPQRCNRASRCRFDTRQIAFG